jgi:hypothetical protein
LRKYGVQVGTDFAMRLARSARFPDPREVIATVPRGTTNKLAEPFAEDILLLSTARIVKPDAQAQKYKAEPILVLDPKVRLSIGNEFYWAESNVRALVNPGAFFKEQGPALLERISETPLPVAVAVSEKLFGTGEASFKPRLVVFGDAEFVDNAELSLSKARGNDQNFLWVTSALNWMSDRQGLIGPRSKETTSYSLNPLTVNTDRLKVLPGWLMTLSIISLGAGIWIVRRR